MEIAVGQHSCPFLPWRPEDGRIFERFSYDTETTEIDDERPYLIPAFVVAAACDGRRGVFLSRENIKPFFEAHQGAVVIMHNAAFDLRVTAPLLSPNFDIYRLVDENRIWDTMILRQLFSLATVGHTARGESSLGDSVLDHLGIILEKKVTDASGKTVRTSFASFLGKPLSEIPEPYLAYLGRDALATWHLIHALHQSIKELLQNAHGVWGFVNDSPDRFWGAVSNNWLRDVIRRFGQLTHHIQLRASILMDVLTCDLWMNLRLLRWQKCS